MIDWSSKSVKEIKEGVDENGNRLLSVFAKEYKDIMGGDLCPNCPGFENKVRQFTLKNRKMEDKPKTEFKLKAMYNGIPMPGEPFGTSKYVSNANLTDEIAKKLIKKHPKGVDLFDKLPKDFKEERGIIETVKDKISPKKSK